jgi:hypothetical protein
MEERQIQEFVHRVSRDDTLRKELIGDPERVIAHQGFSPRVARVVMQLVPHLSFGESLEDASRWWR